MKAAERQAARRRVYSLTLLGGIVCVGGVMIFMAFGGTRRQTAKMYRDPVLALREIFAIQETLWRRDHPRHASLEELVKEGKISDEVLEGPVLGYRYSVSECGPVHFLVHADPEGPQPPPPPGMPAVSARHYTVDETHTVRADAGPVTSSSPVVWSPRDAGPR